MSTTAEHSRFPLQRGWRIARRALAWGALVAALLVVGTATGRYFLRAIWAEARILSSRRPIAGLVADPGITEETRAKLRMVLDARAFAADSLDMRVGGSFTTFSQLQRDTLILVLSGAYRDRLERYTWWFPIVGRVPYKGYFNFDQARRDAERLGNRGFDVYLRPASAFSTLGYFNDPLLSTTLRADVVSLANTVIHELTHNTFYAPGQAVFNESFANFVGARGAEWFFLTRGDSVRARVAREDWADDKLLARFWEALYAEIDSAFSAHPEDSLARLGARERIYADARRRMSEDIAPRLLVTPPRVVARFRYDNAALLARRIYLTELDLFDEVHEREGRDLRRSFARIRTLAESRPDEPFEAVREWLASAPAETFPQ